MDETIDHVLILHDLPMKINYNTNRKQIDPKPVLYLIVDSKLPPTKYSSSETLEFKRVFEILFLRIRIEEKRKISHFLARQLLRPNNKLIYNDIPPASNRNNPPGLDSGDIANYEHDEAYEPRLQEEKKDNVNRDELDDDGNDLKIRENLDIFTEEDLKTSSHKVDSKKLHVQSGNSIFKFKLSSILEPNFLAGCRKSLYIREDYQDSRLYRGCIKRDDIIPSEQP